MKKETKYKWDIEKLKKSARKIKQNEETNYQCPSAWEGDMKNYCLKKRWWEDKLENMEFYQILKDGNKLKDFIKEIEDKAAIETHQNFLKDIEKLRVESYEEGYSQGKKDGHDEMNSEEEAYDQGYQDGFQENINREKAFFAKQGWSDKGFKKSEFTVYKNGIKENWTTYKKK